MWDNTGGKFDPAFTHIADVEYWNRLFSKDMLYIVFANLAAANVKYVATTEATAQFKTLQNSFPSRSGMQQLISAAFYPFFNKDVPVLRGLHKSQHRYSPLIRFDYNSQSFYLSEY